MGGRWCGHGASCCAGAGYCGEDGALTHCVAVRAHHGTEHGDLDIGCVSRWDADGHCDDVTVRPLRA